MQDDDILEKLELTIKKLDGTIVQNIQHTVTQVITNNGVFMIPIYYNNFPSNTYIVEYEAMFADMNKDLR